MRLRITLKRSATVYDYIASIFSESNEKALSHSKFSASANRRLELNFDVLERIDFMLDYLDLMPEFRDLMPEFRDYMTDYFDFMDVYLDIMGLPVLLVAIALRSETFLFEILVYCCMGRKLPL